jgi:SAM-dependent methyltransferase
VGKVIEKFDRLATGYSARTYADPERHAARRADAILAARPRTARGESVLDLGCGDGTMAGQLAGRGLRYRGVDASPGMIDEARRRFPALQFEVARSEDYEPPEPVDVTICLNAFYYPQDQIEFFRRVASYTRAKFVFDFRPSAGAALPYDPAPVLGNLQAGGFADVELLPFFLPQSRRLPPSVIALVGALERSGPLARLLLRRFGMVLCVARP